MVLAALQAILVLVIVKPNPAIKSLSHRMTVYIYKMLRYIVLCESEKPYPFGPLPQEIEPADDVDLRAEVPEKNMFDRDKAPEAGKAPEDPSTWGIPTMPTRLRRRVKRSNGPEHLKRCGASAPCCGSPPTPNGRRSGGQPPARPAPRARQRPGPPCFSAHPPPRTAL